MQRLRSLGLNSGLRGKRFHVAYIVATMATHGIRTLVTESEADFAVFDEAETHSVPIGLPAGT